MHSCPALLGSTLASFGTLGLHCGVQNRSWGCPAKVPENRSSKKRASLQSEALDSHTNKKQKHRRPAPHLTRTLCAGRHRADILIKVPTAKFRTWPWKVEFFRRGCLRLSAGVPRIRVRKGRGVDIKLLQRVHPRCLPAVSVRWLRRCRTR